jgi:hypothetical protein
MAGRGAADNKPFFKTRGVVVFPSDIATWSWLDQAVAAGLTTLALHVTPDKRLQFAKSDVGQSFLAECRKRGIEYEWESHAMADLLPRALFEKAPSLFRMDEAGNRLPDANLCAHSAEALDIVCANAVRYAKELPSSTHRYFYWIDDGLPMCRCPKCKEFTDSEQALLVENAILKALRNIDARATLAHLCYHNTLTAPEKVKPAPGIFLEYAPIARQYDQPLDERSAKGHAALADALDANLAVFGAEGAQALEYWLDVSRFSGWKRENLTKVPWNDSVYRQDLAFYGKRGIRHITTFACWIDGEYAAKFGAPPVAEYGKGMMEVRG